MKVHKKFSIFLIFTVSILSLIVDSGCATTGQVLNRVTDAEKKLVLSGSSLSLSEADLHDLPQENVMGLTDEMKAFVSHAISRYRGQGETLRALLEAIISPRQLGLQYDGSATYTASETFKNRRANCLSFTTMIISMLRYAGLKAEFNDVDIPPVWDLHNNNMLVMYRHVNAIVTWPDGGREVVDFNLDEYNIHYPQHPVRDDTAIAQYYNNRGVEYLLQNNIQDAFRYLLKAVDSSPDIPFIWINLGALYRNQGKLKVAEIAYRKALEIEPDNPRTQLFPAFSEVPDGRI